PATISVFRYDDDGFEEHVSVTAEKACELASADGTTWINIDSVSDIPVIEHFGNALDLHPLLLEDLTHTTQRPKLENYDEKVFVVLRMVRPLEVDDTSIFERERQTHFIEQIALILGPGYVLSFQEKPGDVFETLRERIRQRAGTISASGADYLLYALIDIIVDHYFITLEHIGDATEALEERLFEDPEPELQQSLSILRREVVVLRRSIWPLRDVLNSLLRDDLPMISEKTRLYLRDALDHLVQALEILESLRDVLSSLADLYLSAISHKMNEVMKVLTVVGALFIPLSFLTGLYGMNFDNIPELHFEYGYFFLLGVMVIITTATLYYFRRKRWL
ncbi:MAG: magnesium/cobalt transporter CorA, partial [Rubricoccaceae bacterium]|nr:magnesium/cobalt transporter CorA [Rubricoccaceae bacterium]